MSQPWPTWPASPLAILTIRNYGIATVAYGLLICLGGPLRWSGPQYRTVNLVPGSPYIWGAAMVALGVCTVAGSITARTALRNVGLYGIAVWLLFFAIGILNEASRIPTVSFSGAALYILLAANACTVARAEEGDRHDGDAQSS